MAPILSALRAPLGLGQRGRGRAMATLPPIARPFSRPHFAVFVFANSDAGGGKARAVLDNLPSGGEFNVAATFALDEIRVSVFNLKQPESRKAGLAELARRRKDGGSHLRVVVAGGDGTVKWVISELKLIGCLDVPLGVIPFGTGNDLSRICGWGSGAPKDLSRRGLERLLLEYCLADPVHMDMWEATLTVDEANGHFEQARAGEILPVPEKKIMSSTVLNYCSIGHDARAVFNFETHRHQSQAANTFQFAVEGGLLSLPFRGQNLQVQRLTIDGKEVAMEVVQGLVFENINSYAAGSDFWGKPQPSQPHFFPQHTGDGILEVLAVGKVLDIGIYKGTFGRAGGLRRFAQGKTFDVEFLPSDQVLYFHFDGEPGRASHPKSLMIRHAYNVSILHRNDAKLALFSSLSRDCILISGVLLKAGTGRSINSFLPRFVAVVRRHGNVLSLEWFNGRHHRGSLLLDASCVVARDWEGYRPRPGALVVVRGAKREVRLCMKDQAEADSWEAALRSVTTVTGGAPASRGGADSTAGEATALARI